MTDDPRELDGDPVQRFTALMLGLGMPISEHPVGMRNSLRDEAALPEETRARDRNSWLAFFGLLVDTLKDGCKLGKLRPHDERATALTISSARSGLQGHYAATVNTAPEEATRLTVDVILHDLLDLAERAGNPAQRGLQPIREGTELIARATSTD